MLAALALFAQVTTAPLQPAGKWNVEYGKDVCVLSRPFGDPARAVVFGFQPRPLSAWGELVLVVPDTRKLPARQGFGELMLLPSGRSFKVRFSRDRLDEARLGIRFIAEEDFWDALPEATGISMDVGVPEPIVAALGPMRSPMAAMKACGDDLLRFWGADPAVTIRLSGEAAVAAFHPDNYPDEARRKGHTGLVQALFSIDTSGRATQCRVVIPSGSTILDDQTCAVGMRTIRLPAAAGAPLRYVYLPLRWNLPR